MGYSLGLWTHQPIDPNLDPNFCPGTSKSSSHDIDSLTLEALGAEKQTLEILSESLKIVNQYNVTWLQKYDVGRSSFFGKTEVENMYRLNCVMKFENIWPILALSTCEFM